MATHFVGQKVRVNCPDYDTHGKETTITRIGVIASDFGRQYIGHEVELRVDDQGSPFHGMQCVFETHELIPIQDRNEVTTWEKCAWSPHGVSA